MLLVAELAAEGSALLSAPLFREALLSAARLSTLACSCFFILSLFSGLSSFADVVLFACVVDVGSLVLFIICKILSSVNFESA